MRDNGGAYKRLRWQAERTSASWLAEVNARLSAFVAERRELDDAASWLPPSKIELEESLVDPRDEHGSMVPTGGLGVGKPCVLRALRHRLAQLGIDGPTPTT